MVERPRFLGNSTIKCTMQMDILRCKTPEMVHKEIWTHLLAYNLLRTVMSVAAEDNDTEPRKISFKGAKQALTAFAPKIEFARPEERATLIDAMITTIAYHRVGNRPGRWEPRARKRWPKPGVKLTQPGTSPNDQRTMKDGSRSRLIHGNTQQTVSSRAPAASPTQNVMGFCVQRARSDA